MSNTIRKQTTSKHPNRSAIPSNVARGMILGETGKGGPMKNPKDKRTKNPKRDWRGEDYSD